jgi:hypothetical protein
MRAHQLDGALSVVCFDHLVYAKQLQQVVPEHQPHRRMVVNDQDGCHAWLRSPGMHRQPGAS